MAVGTRFYDAETQAAIAAQGGANQQTQQNADADAAASQAAADAKAAQAAQAAADAKAKADADAAAQAQANADANVSLNMNDHQTTDGGDNGGNNQANGTDDGSNTDDSTANRLDSITEKNLADNGLNMKELVKQVRDNGGIVPDSLKSQLEAKYTPEAIKAAVESVEGQFKQTNSMNTYIFETLAGGNAEEGKKNFATLSTWCKENMDKGEIAVINTLLASGDKEVVRQGLQQAVNAWKKGQETVMMSGNAQVTNGNQNQQPAFEPLSRDEFREIMKTEKYQTDMDYQKSIDDRRNKTLEIQGGRGFYSPEYSSVRPPIR